MLFWHKYRAGDPRKYEGLQMSEPARQLIKNDPKQFKSYCNGVGSRVGFWNKMIYHFIPDFIGLINITPSSDNHDVDFSYPLSFANMAEAWKAFREANDRFLANLTIQIERSTYLKWIENFRLKIAHKYFDLVNSQTGWQSFMDGRTVNGKTFTSEQIDKYYSIMEAI